MYNIKLLADWERRRQDAVLHALFYVITDNIKEGKKASTNKHKK